MNLKTLLLILCIFCCTFCRAEAGPIPPNKTEWYLPCANKVSATLPVFIRQESFEPFDVKRLKIDIPIQNDVMCDDPERMMNAVITVETRTEKWYGIFHIHWLPSGEVKSMNHYGQRWRKFKEDSEWRSAWCEFIRTVYPDDHRLQCLAK